MLDITFKQVSKDNPNWYNIFDADSDKSFILVINGFETKICVKTHMIRDLETLHNIDAKKELSDVITFELTSMNEMMFIETGNRLFDKSVSMEDLRNEIVKAWPAL